MQTDYVAPNRLPLRRRRPRSLRVVVLVEALGKLALLLHEPLVLAGVVVGGALLLEFDAALPRCFDQALGLVLVLRAHDLSVLAPRWLRWPR